MKSFYTRFTATMLVALMFTVCMPANLHREAVEDNSADRMTVGKVQREITVGMSGAEVATVLGSPNIVSTDELRREVWIYDKIASTKVHSTSSGGVSALIIGASAGALPSYSQGSGATSQSQRTLTVIIKFDEKSQVRDFAYHTSRF